MCGEKSRHRNHQEKWYGSPPRVRGKVMPYANKNDGLWITPACAGKSKNQRGKYVGRKDHPRVCGEKPYWQGSGTDFSGSPPRVRGKANNVLILNSLSGITPACAGKSIKVNPINTRSKDHPRVCGEKVIHY